MNDQRTRARPRSLVLDCPPMVLIHPKASSMRFLTRWLAP
jgi:hypothetical protein